MAEKILKAGGFYRSYKHDPKKGINDQVYQFLYVGHNKNQRFIIYRPVYESYVYKLGYQVDCKSIEEWFELIENGVEKYSLIKNQGEINLLEEKLNELYEYESHCLPEKEVVVEL